MGRGLVRIVARYVRNCTILEADRQQCRVQGSGARRQPVEKSPQRRDSLRDDGLLHVDRRVAQLAASHVVEGLRAGAAR
jgi:hypothetical protein